MESNPTDKGYRTDGHSLQRTVTQVALNIGLTLVVSCHVLRLDAPIRPYALGSAVLSP